MTQISVIAKESHTLLNQVDSNTVSLSENSVVVVKIPKEDVASITRSGDSAMINLKNGQVIVVENYFNMTNPDNSLVFEGEDGSLYWAKFTDGTGAIADVIQYQPLSEIEPLLYKDSLTGVILPWALGAGGAGLIGAAASGGGSSDESGNGQPAAAPKKLAAFEVADNAAPKIGKLASGDVSNDKTPVVSGSGAEPGAAIKVYDAG